MKPTQEIASMGNRKFQLYEYFGRQSKNRPVGWVSCVAGIAWLLSFLGVSLETARGEGTPSSMFIEEDLHFVLSAKIRWCKMVLKEFETV